MSVFKSLLFLYSCLLSSWAFAEKLTLQDFLADPGLIAAKISPDGKNVAGVWNEGDKRLVMIYDLDDKKIISKFGDNIIRPFDVSWANNERILVKLLVPYATSKVRHESENEDDFNINDYFMFGRIVATDLKGEGLVELMNDERSARRSVNLARIPHYLPNDEKHILMTSFRNERLALFKVNVDSGESDAVVTGGRFTVAFINDEDGKVLFRYDYKRIARMIEIFEFTEDRDWVLIDEIYFDEDDESKNKIDIRDLVGTKEGKLVYRKMNEKSGFHELITVENGDKKVLVSLPNIDIVGVITQGLNNEVIGYTVLTDIYRSKYFDTDTQAKYDSAAKYFENENFRFVNWGKDKARAVVLSWGMDNPSTFFTFDLKEDQMSTLSYPFATLPKSKLAQGFKVQYKARDNMLITAYVMIPPEFDGTKSMPLIVLPHGGPQHRDFMGYDDLAQFIATRGYVVIKPNFRGSTGYGKAFEEAGYKEWGGKMQEDLEDAVKFLIAEQIADKDRVCIVGASYGGYAALMGAVKTPDMFQCVVSISGVTHLPEQVDYDLDKFESDTLITFIKDSIGDPEKDIDMLKARSPALHAKNINVPVLLIHGDEDEVVPFEQSELMFDALEDINKSVRMITLKDTGHNALYYEQDIEDVYTEIEAFLLKHLPVNKQSAE
ncbi:alpha/beta hydrolase family protein [Glaciecola sp. SC05]|uniref:alpha/beta hydrolase family protein n=1 Tax=Glaciecola sp. SC05 TaxID=1987355 RepID=UPI0035283B5F